MVSRLFVDSRYAISRSESGSTCEFDTGGFEVTPKTRVWLAEFQCVNAWMTIDDSNKYFYIVEEGANSHRTILLQKGAHDVQSIIEDLQAKLNSGSKPVSMGNYLVERIGTSSGSASFTHIRITCDGGAGFSIPPDDEVEALWLYKPTSTNYLMPFPTGSQLLNSHTSGFVDLRRAHSMFVHAPSFGSYNCRGNVVGSQTVLAKVPVTCAYGELLSYVGSGSEHDCIEAGVRSLQLLKLSLRDAHGNEMQLDSSHWSATLVFEKGK